MPDATPNYLRQNVDGSVKAVFPGGIETDSTSPQPTNFPYPQVDSGIRWTAADGGLVAQISAYDNSQNPPPGARTTDTLNIQTVSPDGTRTTALQIGSANSVSPGAGSIFAFFDTFFQEIIGQDGASSYPQLNGSHSPKVWNYQSALQMAFGVVTAAGARAGGTQGWNVVRNGVGTYTLSNLPTTTVGWFIHIVPVVAASPLTGNQLTAPANGCQYQLFNTITGANVDVQHAFILWSIVNSPPNI